jgi:hypothetical protein
MEAVCYSEMSVNFLQITRCHIPEDTCRSDNLSSRLRPEKVTFSECVLVCAMHREGWVISFNLQYLVAWPHRRRRLKVTAIVIRLFCSLLSLF